VIIRPILLLIALIAAVLTSDRPGRAEAANPEAVLQRVNEQFGALRDYECLVDTDCQAGSKQEARSFRMWYKQPGMLRLKVLRGRSRGSEVVVASDGTIRGRKGGLLKPIVIRMDAEDARVRSLRGVPVSEFLWSAFYSRYRARAAQPGARITLLPHQEADAPYEIQLTYADQGRAMREVLRVDPVRWLVQEREIFEGATCVDRAVFHDWKVNGGLKDGWFRL